MTEDNFQMGAKVRDVITEFTGTATGICEYISGCTQVLVQPKVGDDGKRPEGEWFDIQRLEQVGNEFISLENEPAPGFDRLPPKR